MIPGAIAEVAARAQRELSGRVLAITLRSVRDLDIAEEATADAFLLALQTWPERGVPASVEAWLGTGAGGGGAAAGEGGVVDGGGGGTIPRTPPRTAPPTAFDPPSRRPAAGRRCRR